MRIAIFGANGRIGSAISAEALQRGHAVTAAVRSPARVRLSDPQLKVVQTRIDDAARVAAAVRGHDAVIDAVGGLGHDNPRISIECMKPLTLGLRKAGVKRLLVVGTAGTLKDPQGGLRKDQAGFPEKLATEAQAHAEVLNYLRQPSLGDLKWTYFSPPVMIEPGERTGQLKIGNDTLLFDNTGRSYISNEDFAMATIDEIEDPRHIGSQMTAISFRPPY